MAFWLALARPYSPGRESGSSWDLAPGPALWCLVAPATCLLFKRLVPQFPHSIFGKIWQRLSLSWVRGLCRSS